MESTLTSQGTSQILVLSCALGTVLIGLLTFVFSSVWKDQRALIYWGFSSLLLGIGYFLTAASEFNFFVVPAFLPKIILALSSVLLTVGLLLHKYNYLPSRFWIYVTAIALILVPSLVFNNITGNYLFLLAMVISLIVPGLIFMRMGGYYIYCAAPMIFRCFVLLSVPILTANELSNVLFILSDLAFSLQGIALIGAAAIKQHTQLEKTQRDLSIALEKAKEANKDLETYSVTDQLTGLLNRRKFNDIMTGELKRARRDNKYLFLMLLDLDYFKSINDQYGHIEGDRALMRVSECLQGLSKRASDFAFRLGGEEFCIVSTDSDKEKGAEFAEKIRQSIFELAIPNETAPTGFILTISIGVAVSEPTNGLGIEEMYTIADENLYKAKHAGRNKVIGP